MPNELDEFMDLDPLELKKDDARLDQIIAYQRKHRANVESGVKAKKETGPKKALTSVLDNLIKRPVTEAIKRRV